MHINKQV